MERILYDLAGVDPALRFSPYCWRARMALAHKGLEVETVPWRFKDKPAIQAFGHERVPVLVDGDRAVGDSWAIAVYLEEAYPDRPSLFGGPQALAVTRFVKDWADLVLNPGIANLIVGDIHPILHEGDKAYFRRTREERFGRSLEDMSVGREERLGAFRQSLRPLRATLESRPYLAGEGPNYADYIVFGSLQWARVSTPFELLEAGDPIARWREGMLDLFHGLARSAPTAVELRLAS